MASADNLEICLCREGIDITLDKGNYNEEEFEEEMLQVIVHQEILGSSYELEPLKTYEPLKAKRSKESCFYDFYTPPPDIKEQNQDAIEEPVGVIVKSGVDQVRLHWPLLMHCFHSLFATPIPALNFPTRGGRWLWREWGHNRIADSTYVKDIIRGVNNTVLLFHVHKHPHFEEIYIPELLLKIKQLDDLSVAHFLKVCYQFFSIQRKVFSASFDNARVNEFQAAVMITGIARGSGGFTKCLYTWNVCEFKIEDEASTLFTESVKLYTNLSLLSINFSVLGNRLEGLELICHLIGGTKKKLILQLLVQSLTDGEVNDKRWRQTAAKCPGLIVRMLLVVVPKYQEIRKFFSKWMPLQEICIFCNWRTQNMASWCLECTLQMLSTFYGEKLGYLQDF